MGRREAAVRREARGRERDAMAKQGKGQAFEREICSRLSRWWTDGRRDDVFWRSAGSGARATSRGRRGKQTANQHGDVAAVDPCGAVLTDLFVIELKRGYNSSTVHDLLDRREGAAEQTYERWIKHAMEDVRAAGAAGWLLIVRRDRHEAMIWMDVSTRMLFDQIGVDLRVDPCCTMTAIVRREASEVIESRPIRASLFGMTLENFLLNVPPEAITKLGNIA